MPSPNRYTVGVLAVVITSILWGTTGTAAAFAPTASPLAIGSAALGIGGLAQFTIAIPAVRRSRSRLRRHRGVITIGGIAVAVYPLAFYSSMNLAGVAIGSVISLASAPLFSGLLELVVDRTRLSRRWGISAALAVTGGAILILSQHAAAGPDLPAGSALGLVAGATYATYSWASRRLMSDDVERSAAMGVVFGLGGALLMPVLIITGAPLIASAQVFAVAAYMALVPMLLGYVLFGIGLARIPASTATTVTLLEPAVATILAVVVLGERIAALGWLGIAFIGTSLVILTAARARRD